TAGPWSSSFLKRGSRRAPLPNPWPAISTSPSWPRKRAPSTNSITNRAAPRAGFNSALRRGSKPPGFPFMRVAFLFCLAVVAASGQWNEVANVATTDDGSVIYFSSTLRLRGTDQFESPKIFRADATSVSLFAQRKSEEFFNGFDLHWTNFFLLTEPELSGD